MSQDLFAPGRLVVGKVVRDALDFRIRVVSSGTGAESYARLEHYDATGQINLTLGRARGTAEAPAIVQAGDIMGELEFFAYTNQWHHCAEIASTVCGAPAAGTIPDSDLQLKTTNAGAADVTRVRVMPGGQTIMGDAVLLTEAQITANGKGRLWIAGTDAHDALAVQRDGNNSGGSAIYGRKGRGTLAAPATVVTGDEMLYVQGSAYTNQWHDNCGAIALYVDGTVTAGQRPGNRIAFRTGISGAGGPSDRMVIYSGGAVVVGSGTADTTRIFHVVNPTTSFSIARIQSTGGGATNNCLRLDGGDNAVTGSTFIAFHRPDGTEIGSIKQNAAGTVQYNTTSDGRLKENIEDMDSGIALVSALRPRRFNFRGDRDNTKRGFIAQEVHAVIPEVVSVGGGAACACDLTKRAENPDGEHLPTCCRVNPWAIDYGLLTPVLVKAVQELNSRLEALENG